MRVLIGSVALGAMLLAGPVLASEASKQAKMPPAQRSCFRAGDVSGFNVVDDKTVDVSINSKTVYRLTLFSRSPDIDWTQRIGIKARGSSWICQGLDAEIIVPGSIGPTTYPVTEVRKLTPEEIASKKTKKK
ncbi:DUF6491 family protein [Caulobacter segnis]|uniref:DUF6491 family protein n=1 Tax=Caulobacter segnis TaxID=88688 RepID=UPI001CBDD7BC|nr:DUF6491 family protein [Caulobacter segnis]UAL10038.1 DUF6491 family protein [Caulobacter segnis]